MKIERKIAFVHSLINACLVLSIALNGVMLYLFSKESNAVFSSQSVSWIALANSLLLFAVLIAINLHFRKLRIKQGGHFVDEVTGFMTRQDFVPVFKQSMLDSGRSDKPLSLLMIDIDHFRRVNEKHGQHAGDQVLSMLSNSIQSKLRTSDFACRWAGDQFLVILKDSTVQDACRRAATILDTLHQQQLVLGGKTIRITTSIGVAQMVTDDVAKTLIARAETGLHSAIDHGRNTYAIGYDWILLEYYSKPIF